MDSVFATVKNFFQTQTKGVEENKKEKKITRKLLKNKPVRRHKKKKEKKIFCKVTELTSDVIRTLGKWKNSYKRILRI